MKPKNIINEIQFIEELKERLKYYPPENYAPFVSKIINDSLELDYPEYYSFWPPHWLLHSIEANCAFYDSKYKEKITPEKLKYNILNLYGRLDDPVAKYHLKTRNDLEYFLIYLSRQQIYFLQKRFNIYDLGRAVEMFLNSDFKNSERVLLKNHKLSFVNWIFYSFIIFYIINKKNWNMFSSNDLKELFQRGIIEKESFNSFLDMISVSISEVKTRYYELRNNLKKELSLKFEIYFPSIFYSKPLLRFDNAYLLVVKSWIIEKAANGIYDLLSKDLEFRHEFGLNFQNYVSKLLKRTINKSWIYDENELKKYTKGLKTCDFLINFKDYILLVECKGIQYRHILLTERAIETDTSTKEIAKGLDQLISTAKIIKSGLLNSLLGEDAKNKKILSILITFKETLPFTNGRTFWELLEGLLGSDSIKYLRSYFYIKPQIIPINVFEVMLLYSKRTGKKFTQIFEEKLGSHKSSDWSQYFNNILKETQSPKFLKIEGEKFISSRFK